jgi:small subunit ribosomal protein S8
MVMTDPIADFLARVKNGYLARKKEIVVPYSKIKEQLSQILVKEGYLKNVKCKMQNVKLKTLELELKYEGKKPALTEVKRISKPGLRIYTKATKIPKVRLGFGITIVSTSLGLMTDKKAKKLNLGGEVICQIW